jgi:hypothetical protein
MTTWSGRKKGNRKKDIQLYRSYGAVKLYVLFGLSSARMPDALDLMLFRPPEELGRAPGDTIQLSSLDQDRGLDAPVFRHCPGAQFGANGDVAKTIMATPQG